MNRATFNRHISASSFRELFITELGWNKHKGQSTLPTITIDETEYTINCIAERNGFQILTCVVESIPVKSVLQRIDVKLRRQANDYICIYILSGTCHHEWVAPVKNNEKRELVLIEYSSLEQADFLFSKVAGLTFELDEKTTIMDVRERIQITFAVNSERITKEFYAGFRKEHTAFAEFISGLDDNISTKDNKNKQWYTSVMLNRLMFCYFVQKKGFLNSDTDYLRHKLEWVQKEYGENSFYKSFYRSFLIHLFHEGLNAPSHDREFEKVYGRIPYLNGGMFDNHQLEQQYGDIEVADEAFIRLFDFFDNWQWHLDTRITATGKDINPDVLGFIFEQYINDRAAMGAYYTKEDITEYIGKNCIIPFLMDKVAESSSRDEFKPNGYVWQSVINSADTYIYDAVKKGYSNDWKNAIPDYIAKGLDITQPELLERRSRWNEITSEQFALPTEIWRETIDRLQRCEGLLYKINAGEIQHINDFITYNLDIRQFTYDLLLNAKDHHFVGNFYHALQKVSILDPTCGSGAFLFAAMNILEPLYEVCIIRMQEYNEQNPHLFKEELGEIANKYRSNIQYFIYKSIILRNLYGVDIMIEATEIAKLRLFLKMVAVVEVDKRADNLGLDPLPDVDFNIRCGNTLVGYANEEELNKDLDHYSDFLEQLANQEFAESIKNKMDVVARTYNVFKEVQLIQTEDRVNYKEAKIELQSRLAELNDLLNQRLFNATADTNKSYEVWLKSHQPFHWLAEFYQIIHGNGGFDVIIGNPPYVGYTRKNKTTNKAIIDYYQVRNFETLPTSNLYSFCIERSQKLINFESKIGMIIPISAFANNSMKELQQLFKSIFSNLYVSTFHQRPAQLFDGVLQRLSIFIGDKKNVNDHNIYTSGIYRWYSETRKLLFQSLSFVKTEQNKQCHFIKLGQQVENQIFNRYSNHRVICDYLSNEEFSNNNIFYRTAGGGYWVTFLFNEFDCVSISNKHSTFFDKYNSKIITAVLNSNLFWWYYSVNYDLFNFKDYMIFGFQFTYPDDCKISNSLLEASNKLESFLRDNALFYDINSITRGLNRTVTYQKGLSKYYMDEIDKVLAKHYGFTEEELDFIINYDIKYRMGDELNNNEE